MDIQKTRQKEFDVVSIGNSIVDILIYVDEDYLSKQSLNKGSMTLIDDSKANKLYSENIIEEETSGGSAANTSAGISQLGGIAGFIGRVKNDQAGKTFTKEITSIGVAFNTPPIEIGPSTAQCLIFITPDAQRTMCTSLGASVYLNPKDIDISMVTQTKILYLEGYLWDSDEAKKAFTSAAKKCRTAKGEIALSLSDSFCIKRHRDSFIKLIDEYVDIVFSNEEEIKSIAQTSSVEKAIKFISKKCKILVVTMGEKGSTIIHGDKIIKIESYKFGRTIDTTGAGDIYASGFLYGYTTGESLETCGRIGSICAGHIVTKLGPRSNISLTDLVKKNLH